MIDNKSTTANLNSLYNVHLIRKDFPMLSTKINAKNLIWFDNAATTQKPRCLLDALNKYYTEINSNVFRGDHDIGKKATEAYESARRKVGKFIGAKPEEIVFLRGATEAINLVAECLGEKYIKSGDEIIISTMEHHSNILPWQNLRERRGAVLKVIPVNAKGEIILEEFERLLTPRTKILAITHVSNVLGTINPVKTLIEIAHHNGTYVLIDGAQAVPHVPIDVKELDADFYAFSGHKVYGPMGIGVLYGKSELLDMMPVWQRGGGMIKKVDISGANYKNYPYKFEAGTPNVADAVALGEVLEYLNSLGRKNIEKHERSLTNSLMYKLSEVRGVKIIGKAQNKISVVSFIINRVPLEKATSFLNKEGIALRSGYHCAQPLFRWYGISGSLRASLGLYNTEEEIEIFIDVIKKIARG